MSLQEIFRMVSLALVGAALVAGDAPEPVPALPERPDRDAVAVAGHATGSRTRYRSN
jgi:hypothetical protein